MSGGVGRGRPKRKKLGKVEIMLDGTREEEEEEEDGDNDGEEEEAVGEREVESDTDKWRRVKALRVRRYGGFLYQLECCSFDIQTELPRLGFTTLDESSESREDED